MVYRGIAVALLAFAAAVAVLTGTVRYTETDTIGTLLTAEQIIDNGTVALDAYDGDYLRGHFQFYEHNGHYYDFFPMGTSVVMVPAVAGAKLLGFDVFEQRADLEVALAAMVAAGLVVSLYFLARQFVGFGTSLALAGVAWFGTTLSSTMSTALWSIDLATLFGALSLLLTIRITARGDTRLWPVLGGTLFLGWLCRPTMATLGVVVLTYLFGTTWRAALGVAATTVALLVGFMAFSLATFDALLPAYYRPQRLSTDTFAEALAGHLVSPSRGLLVYVPVLLLIPVFALVTPSRVRQHAGLLMVALGWPLLQWLVVSRHPEWYGGISYGPRLMTEVLPGLFLAIVLLWPASLRAWPARIAVAFGAVLAALGVWVNTVQGLHNEQTLYWNAAPRVEARPDKVWDWRYPQWLATPERELQRLTAYDVPLEDYPWD